MFCNTFLKTCCQEMLKTRMQRASSFAIEFSRFWGAKSMIFDDFGRSEVRFFVILEVRGPILRILWIFVFPDTKQELPGTKKESQNEVILHPKSDFLSVIFLMFF